MTYTTPALARALDAIDRSNRESRRLFGLNMPFDALLDWLTTDSYPHHINLAARWVKADRHNPDATENLCRALMLTIRKKFRGVPFCGRANLTDLRNCFRAVARRYHMQTRRVPAAAE